MLGYVPFSQHFLQQPGGTMSNSNGSNQHTYSGFWNAERVAELKRLYVKEGLSQSQIAARMGCTRNSIIGKCNRLNLQRGSMKKAPRKPVKINTGNGGTKSRAPTVSPDFVMPKPQEFDVARKMLADLEAEDCRFPVDLPDGNGFGFCALERAPGVSYCPAHRDRCINPVPVKPGQKAPANDERVDA